MGMWDVDLATILSPLCGFYVNGLRISDRIVYHIVAALRLDS